MTAIADSQDLESFLRSQDAGTLAAVLLELAADHEVVRQRLLRMQLAGQPTKLAAAFRRTLDVWRRAGDFHDYSEASDFSRRLQSWLDQVARELMPTNPPAAVDLFECFIEADAIWFDCADDSDGLIGDVVRAACRHWLAAAAQCETPPELWSDRLMRLVQADNHGAREELLSCANLLLDQPALRGLVARCEEQMKLALQATPRGERPSHDVYRISGELTLLAKALENPEIMVRAVLAYSPQPNPVQNVQAYLDAGRPEDALVWLQASWTDMELARQDLLADVLERLGRFEESAPIRQKLFERTLSIRDLRLWLEPLPEPARRDATQRARRLACDHKDRARAAALLIELGNAAAAEMVLVDAPERVVGGNYGELVPLAKALAAHGCHRAETVVYRALLTSILERRYAPAYRHAARYWFRLREIADSAPQLTPLASHEDFEKDIRTRHKRKPAFWAHVNGTRRDMPDWEDD